VLSKDLIEKNLPRIKQIVSDPDILIWYKASKQFQKMMVNGKHPSISKMPQKMKEILLQGSGVLIEPNMVILWMEKKLDTNNSFVLDNGEIFITVRNNISSTGVTKEIINLKDDIIKE